MKLILNILFAISLLFTACSGGFSDSETIYIKGSDTMFELTSNLAEVYMKEKPGISIKIEAAEQLKELKH